MTPMSRFLRSMRYAIAPAERPVIVVVVLADPAGPPETNATPALPHLDFDLAIRQFDEAAMAGNTRKAYTGELRRYQSWLDGRPPTDRLLAGYLGMLYDKGRSPRSGELAVAAVKRAALESARASYEIAEPPAGHLAAERLERFRREGAGRGRGQAGPLDWKDADDMGECAGAAGDPRGIRDAALIGVASDALLRVSEASALDAGDVSFRNDGSAHVEIRRGKTDQHGKGAVRYVAPAATERLRKWMDAAGIGSGPLFRPCRAAASGRPGWARRPSAPSSSAGPPRRGSRGACPGTRCASALPCRWPSTTCRWRSCSGRAAGSRRRCRATTCATRRRRGARWRGCGHLRTEKSCRKRLQPAKRWC